MRPHCHLTQSQSFHLMAAGVVAPLYNGNPVKTWRVDYLLLCPHRWPESVDWALIHPERPSQLSIASRTNLYVAFRTL